MPTDHETKPHSPHADRENTAEVRPGGQVQPASRHLEEVRANAAQ